MPLIRLVSSWTSSSLPTDACVLALFYDNLLGLWNPQNEQGFLFWRRGFE